MSIKNSKFKIQNSFWPLVIAGALILHVVAMMAMVAFATSDESYTVEPDYYKKALAWDERRAQDRHNTELGWTLEFTVEPALPGTDPTLRVTLHDAGGEPIADARIDVETFSNIRRDDILTATISGDGEAYTTPIPMRGNGRWEFRFHVTRGSDLFTYRETRHIWTHVSR